jgi:4'-phosphopantetheinyl transferase
MPVLPEITISSKEKILMWEIEESTEYLAQLAGVPQVSDEEKSLRQIQQLASAAIVAHVYPGIKVQKDAWGKPWLPEGYPAISMSHSKHWAAVLFASAPSCGVDLEKLGDKIMRIEQKF